MTVGLGHHYVVRVLSDWHPLWMRVRNSLLDFAGYLHKVVVEWMSQRSILILSYYSYFWRL